MDANRISQLRNLQASRDEIVRSVPNLNSEVIEELGYENLKNMISDFVSENELSLKDLEHLVNMMEIETGIPVDRMSPIVELLTEILCNTVLLPNYHLDNHDEYFEELDELIGTTIERTRDDIQKISGDNPYRIFLARTDNLRDEFESQGNINHRFMHVGGIFGMVSFWNDDSRGFCAQIPVRIRTELTSYNEKESSYRMPENQLLKFINDYFAEGEIKGLFYFPVANETNEDEDIEMMIYKTQDKNAMYGFSSEDTYYVLNLKSNIFIDDFMSDEEMQNAIGKILVSAEAIMNDLAKVSKIPHKKRTFNFSNNYSVEEEPVYEVTIHNNPTQIQSSKSSESDDVVEDFDLDKYKLNIKNSYSLNDIGGLKDAKKQIDAIIKTLKYPEIMKSWGAKATSGMIFEGPPGTGKTQIAKVIASEIDAEVYNIKLTDIA